MIDWISLLLGVHLTVGLISFVLLFVGTAKNGNKTKIYVWLYIISVLFIWEILFPISVVYYSRKRKNESWDNMTKEEKIIYYKEKIDKANERLNYKLEAFDNLAKASLEKWGVISPVEKWTLAMEKWYAEEIISLGEKIAELETD